ncbi:MAG TPA: sigma-54 dependent transcriptional regulator [Thermoanaerobaculaceae bacterium]|nr:sigma-54 dependent transcriptional regulator [Thermoanaerobaculaceae bacterium]HRS15392.1 sigma-54 dependent transcriptional regulator [Thermoanaerobaculaceae bacterium]
MSRARVLLVDDDDGSRGAMALGLRRIGLDVVEVDCGEAALRFFEGGEDADALITDVRMPGIDGYEVARRARELRPEIAILMVTAFGDVDGAVRALQGSADDYLTKPVNLLELRRRVELLLDRRRLGRENRELLERIDKHFGFENIIGRSAAMEQVFERVRVVAPAPSTVLILGESGTGKELIANAIHQHSPRAAGHFVALNCGAIPGEILEAELFGHEKGAFTGAHQRRIGKIELASGGTLFLDEISELSADLQVKLLRVLEERKIVRVGGNDEIAVDFRLVAATNRDLEAEIAAGRFRRDLFYRLKVVTIALPPLRQRPEDIPLLVNHFIEVFNRQIGRRIKGAAPALIEALRAQPWPGNVRELRNVMENMVLFCQGDTLTLQDLPAEYRQPASGGASSRPPAAAAPPPEGFRPRTMADIEKEAILQTLEFTGGHRARAAQILDIGLRTLQRKLKEYGAVASDEPEEV